MTSRSFAYPSNIYTINILTIVPSSNVIDRRQVYFDNRTGIDTSKHLSWAKTKCITVNQICPPHHYLNHITDRRVMNVFIKILANK